MKIEEYVGASGKTDQFVDQSMSVALAYYCLKLNGEVNELLEEIESFTYSEGKAVDEAGDVLWYICAILRRLVAGQQEGSMELAYRTLRVFENDGLGKPMSEIGPCIARLQEAVGKLLRAEAAYMVDSSKINKGKHDTAMKAFVSVAKIELVMVAASLVAFIEERFEVSLEQVAERNLGKLNARYQKDTQTQ